MELLKAAKAILDDLDYYTFREQDEYDVTPDMLDRERRYLRLRRAVEAFELNKTHKTKQYMH